MTVYGDLAKRVADAFEKENMVVGYETNVSLENADAYIDHTGIRKKVLDAVWVSDFMVYYLSGEKKIIEVVDKDSLNGPRGFSVCEPLEISRRYWAALGVEWKMIIIQRGETLW